jgi:menaquinone-9 beta-reductase
MKRQFDVIIVGARAAGASLAMLLARQGVKVLAVDRASYGSDTLSTHALMRPGVLQLHRWGLLDAVRATGAPPIRTVGFHFPDSRLTVDIRPADGIDALFAPRRTVLDRILADAARAAGAEIRFGVAVDTLQRDLSGRVTGIVGRDERGRETSPSAALVVGADGIRSVVAQAAGAAVTREARRDGAVVYGYFRNAGFDGYQWAYAPGISAGVIPTNDGEACVFVGMGTRRFRNEFQRDLTGNFRRLLQEASPEIARRIAGSEARGRLRGFAGIRGYYRRPWGEGWALVGDSGFFRDPITTHGISDAFRDAELLARAVTGASSFAEYEKLRDETTGDLFEVTDKIAGYDWTIDEVRGYLREVSQAMKPEVELLLSFDRTAAA